LVEYIGISSKNLSFWNLIVGHQNSLVSLETKEIFDYSEKTRNFMLMRNLFYKEKKYPMIKELINSYFFLTIKKIKKEK